jgi:DICT domain-containing protein/putative methionine-R-sulfoxide reductase with GAF domain
VNISLFRAIAGQYRELLQVHSVPMLNAISHLIENQVMQHRMPVDFYAGFQRFSHFPVQLRRYSRLAASCRRVYVFGVPDIAPPLISGIEWIELAPTDPLAREWFVLVNAPEFWSGLIAQQLNSRDELTGGRRFSALWTYDEQVVERGALLISQLLNDVYRPVAARNYAAQSGAIAGISGQLVEMLETQRRVSQRRWARLLTLHRALEALGRRRHYSELCADVTQILHDLFGAAGAVATAIEPDGTLRLLASAGDTTPAAPATLHEGVSAQAVRQGRPVLLSDNAAQRHADPLVPTARSVCAAPIIGRGRILGVLTVGDLRVGVWSDEDAETLQAIAALLAYAAEQLPAPLNSSLAALQARRMHAALSQLGSLQQRLRKEGALNGEQRVTLGRIEQITALLNRSIGGEAAERAVGS